ncbi:MAG: hypothetical protein AAGG51_06230 [Cyanobacteria bacterium P01_G01_bin.54]
MHCALAVPPTIIDFIRRQDPWLQTSISQKTMALRGQLRRSQHLSQTAEHRLPRGAELICVSVSG